MIIGKSFKQELITEKYDTIIIGSGIGALTSARLLTELGEKVLVLERHYTAGGLTHTFTRKKFEWDTGVHYIGEVHREEHPFRKLFDFISQNNLKWSQMGSEYDRLIFPDEEYSFVRGRENLMESLFEKFPKAQDQLAIRKYIDLLKEVTDAGTSLCMARSLPRMFNTFTCNSFYKKAEAFSKKTTLDALKELTNNPKLIGVLTGQYANYGLPPGQSSFLVHGIISAHYLGGGNYPIGGGSSIARTVIDQIERRGSSVLTRMGVKSISVNNGKANGVILDNDQFISADRIISNAGLHNTFEKLISEKDRGDFPKSSLSRLRYSSGYFSLNIGLSRSDEYLNLPKTNYWFYPGYDHDLNIKKYFNDQSSKLPLSYVSFGSAKDPEWKKRYPNKSTIDILGASSFSWFKKWDHLRVRNRGDEYLELKEKMARPYLERLFEYMPHIKQDLEHYEISTPLTVKSYCQYQRGEIYGLEASGNRFQNRLLRPKTHIKNLYLTGQDMVFGGVCGALASGAMTVISIHPIKGSALLKKIGFFDKVT